MWNYIRNSSAFLVIGCGITYLSKIINSHYLFKFLDENLIIVLMTLFAINIATVSIIVTRLKEISERNNNFDFSPTHKALKASLIEQVCLIVLAVIFFVLKDGDMVKSSLPHSEFIFNTLLTSVFLNAIYVLADTGTAIFKVFK